ncbi:MAG: DUF4838 domain-containing protein [Bacteroidales bacterium]
MTKTFSILAIFLICLNTVNAQNITLVDKAKTDYRIVVSKKAGSYEITAAKILQDYIQKISGCKLVIVNDHEKSIKKEILIGITNRTKDEIIQHKKQSLKEDGYYLYTNEEKLLILGGSGKGIIYGVCGFLEDYLNYRKYSPAVEYIPHNETINIPQLDDTQIPPAEIRIVHCEFTNDTTYAYFRKIVEIKDIWNDGNYHGYYVHTLPRILPSDTYFKDHPEYFSLVNGIRVPYGQFCLSNPAVLKICIAKLKEEMGKHPGIKYWSVSQSDNYYQCECEKCKAIDQEEGSPSGLMIRFVNEVAKAFPDKIITTLAYQYTRKPPMITKPLSNVMITLCTIELNRSLPIETDTGSRAFTKEITDWGKICNKIMLWDYETQFSSSFGPFPLYNTLQPNIQFFTNNHVMAHFQQCNGKHSENFGELKCYLLSKLLWNPKEDVNAIIDDFMKGFYGNAAPYIRQYFDLLHSECKKSGIKLDIYGNPVWLAQTILSESNMKVYNQLFDKAEQITTANPEILYRVKAARLPIMFSAIEIAKSDLFGTRGWYKEENGKYIPKKEMNQMLEDFYTLCKHDSIQALNEKGLSPEFYYNTSLRAIDVQVEGNLAFHKKAICQPPPDPKYTGMGPQLLTNGVRGSEDYKINWLGWEDQDAEIIVDLDSVRKINEINISTLHMPDVWILHPSSIVCMTSSDGQNYQFMEEQKPDPELQYKTDIKTFTFKLKDNQCRYLKMKLTGVKKLPQWHAYKGSKAWIFVDEITVK